MPVKAVEKVDEARFEREIDSAIAACRGVYPVPKALVKAVIRAESGFRPDAVSPTGAVGLMQLMPATGRKLGISVAGLRDPEVNVLGGVRLLAVLLRRYQGDVVSALVAYNARPIARFAPIPRNGETPAYVRAVLENLRRYRREERLLANGGAPTARWRPR
jgi:soluble lytic murein transglycosylase-like protein